MIVISVLFIRNINYDNKFFFSVFFWKFVYFLKYKFLNVVVDFRVIENINVIYLFFVVGSRGVYRYRIYLDVF